MTYWFFVGYFSGDISLQFFNESKCIADNNYRACLNDANYNFAKTYVLTK